MVFQAGKKIFGAMVLGIIAIVGFVVWRTDGVHNLSAELRNMMDANGTKGCISMIQVKAHIELICSV